MSEPSSGGPTPEDGHGSGLESELPIPHRPLSPPTDVIQRGRARLLAQLGGSTMQSELPDSSAWKPPNPEVRDEERYAFGEVLAAGGLGLVRRGEDRRLGRPVAIKELLRDSPEAARRFALEAAITARLQHPGIVPLYDLGWQGEGKPYYCMQLVDGDSLEAKIAAAIGLPARLRLVEHVIAVADAIAYAHERQIIHRDIKPANVLVGRFGETIVIDWGLAKDLSGTMLAALEGGFADAGNESSPDMTEAGTIMGTPRYMSPEQARGEAVDMRSDVYSLGALLFHVLAGEPPFAGGERKALLQRVLTGQLRPLADIDPTIPSELVAIAERAMDLRPDHRYPSAAAFAEDLRSFQAGRLVSAHSYSLGQMLGRWLWRHRVVVGATMLTLAAITAVGIGAALRIDAEAERAEDEAERAAGEAERAERLAFEHDVVAKAKLAGDVLSLARTPGRELEALARGVEAIADYGPDYERAPEAAILGLTQALGGMIPVMLLDGGTVDVGLAGSTAQLTQLSLDGSKLVRNSPPELEVWSLDTAQKLRGIALNDPDFQATVLALSPDNRLVALSNGYRCVVVDLDSGMGVLELDECGDPEFTIDGRSLVAKVPSDRKRNKLHRFYQALTVWDLASGKPRWTVPMPGIGFTTIVHPDGDQLIVRNEGDDEPQAIIDIFSVKTGERQASLERVLTQPRLRPGGASSVSTRMLLSPDGRSLAVGEYEDDERTVLWNLETQTATVLDLESEFSSQMAFSADGHWLLAGGSQWVQIYDLKEQASIASLPTYGFVVGRRAGGLAIANKRWIEFPHGRSIQSVPAGHMRSVKPTLDGRFVITLTSNETRVWSVEEHLALERWTPPPGEFIRQFGRDHILTHEDGVWRIHARTDRLRAPLVVETKLENAILQVSHAPLIGGGRGQPLVVALDLPDKKGIEIRNLATGELRCTVPHENRRVVLGEDGRALAYSTDQGRGHVWDLDLCRERAVVHLHDPAIKKMEDTEPFYFAPDGTLVVYNRRGRGRVTLLDPRGRETHFDEECLEPSKNGYAVLSADGRILMSSCDSSQNHRGRARVWDVARGESIAELDLRDYTSMPVFSSDGKLLIFNAGGYELAVVRVEDGREILRIPTREIPSKFPQMRMREGLPIVDVVTVEGDLVSYPFLRAQLVDVACGILRRSELAAEVAPWCVHDSRP